MTPRPPRRRQHKKKPTERAILGVVRRLVDPETGESVKAIVAMSTIDRQGMRDRGLRLDDVVVMDVFRERNYRFYRLWHQMASFMLENVDEFTGKTQHETLKALQLKAGVHCEEIQIDLGPLGKVPIKQAKSLNFFETDEQQAHAIWEQLCDFIATEYFGDWGDTQIALAKSHWERDQ